MKILEFLNDVQEKIIENKIRPQNALSAKKYMDTLG